MTTFKALWVDKKANESVYSLSLIDREVDALPAGDVLVQVQYSSLNFKDALSAKGNKAVTRQYPHTPGIDAAGIVEQSSDGRFQPGDRVIVTGYDLGMNTPGGFGGYIRVPGDWVIPCPEPLSLRDSMVFGTAGLTAALCVEKLLQMGLAPDQGDVFVSGATGGVGSLSVAILARLGFSVAASTGKLERADYLTELGASKVIDRETIADGSERPLLPESWAGAVDTVGGDILFNIIKSLKYGGSVACCGLVSSPSFQATVFPFILRGVNLLGVDSVELPREKKEAIWQLLAGQWQPDGLEKMTTEVCLAELPEYIESIFKGKQVGRVLVNLQEI
ncbi:YhdH/YhfP family quinone oxidoreductase [Kistimonas asteriae]|uniref:YhdH/YhfP family quinone oxidoreductase n=1 Tax=Kistimonas asteriae TaxID=517724 RepID=UPI001BAA1832|nr:YhdH/YhfP family quinone oxidoreductase [Kistimonas asteriae]